jgi:hypothetical protein
MRPTLALAAVALCGSPAVPADPPPSPEQQVLDRFLGNWKTTYTVPKAEWTPEARTGSATITFERVLGGAFLLERSEHADKSSGMIVRTYDAARKQYRGWGFLSDGQSNEGTGTWDARAKTFTWKVPGPTFLTTARHTFTDDDTFAWDVVVTGTDGKALFRMEGTSTRVKGGKK